MCTMTRGGVFFNQERMVQMQAQTSNNLMEEDGVDYEEALGWVCIVFIMLNIEEGPVQIFP